MAYGLQYDDIIKKETMVCAGKEPEALQILQKQEDKDMVSYARLWKTMEEKGVTQYELIHKYKISSSQLFRLRQNEYVSTRTIERFCNILDCGVRDVMEIVDDGTPMIF